MVATWSIVGGSGAGGGMAIAGGGYGNGGGEAGKQRLKARVALAVGGVGRRIDRASGGRRGPLSRGVEAASGDLLERCRCGLTGRGGSHRQKGGTVGGAFIAVPAQAREGQDIGLDAGPDATTGATAGKREALGLNAHGLDDLQAIEQAEGDTFQDGTNQFRAAVGSGKADPGAARQGIEMGRAFTHEVGQKQQAAGARRRARRFPAKAVIGIAGTGLGAEGVA